MLAQNGFSKLSRSLLSGYTKYRRRQRELLCKAKTGLRSLPRNSAVVMFQSSFNIICALRIKNYVLLGKEGGAPWRQKRVKQDAKQSRKGHSETNPSMTSRKDTAPVHRHYGIMTPRLVSKFLLVFDPVPIGHKSVICPMSTRRPKALCRRYGE